MDNYKLRSDLRNLEEISNIEETYVLPMALLKEIENRLFEMDRTSQLIHNYKEVLKDVLK